jgi:hypothetical protein
VLARTRETGPKPLRSIKFPFFSLVGGTGAGNIPGVMTGEVEICGHSGRDFVNVPFDDGRFQIIRRFQHTRTMSQETIEIPRKTVKWNVGLDVWSHKARQGRGIRATRIKPDLVAVREFKEFFTGHRVEGEE